MVWFPKTRSYDTTIQGAKENTKTVAQHFQWAVQLAHSVGPKQKMVKAKTHHDGLKKTKKEVRIFGFLRWCDVD